MRFLLIDDDPEIRQVAKIALERFGDHEVDCATTAAEGLERLGDRVPDAVLLDVLLPDADGVELLERLRRVEGMTGVPVVFLTGKSTADDIARLERSGARGTIVKPFDPLALRERVERLVGSPTGSTE